MSTPLRFEDLQPDMEIPCPGSHTVDQAEALHYAQHYDSQPMHLDAEAAQASLLGKLTISGWQTAAISHELSTKSPLFDPANEIQPTGRQAEVQWLKPVEVGDTLRISMKITEVKPLKSQSGKGLVSYDIFTWNQRDENVLRMSVQTVCRTNLMAQGVSEAVTTSHAKS